MEIKITIKGLDQLTEALALIGSALAYKNNMVETSSEAVDLMLNVTDKIEDYTEEEKVKKEVIKETVKAVVQEPVSEKVIKTEHPPAITIEQIREVFVNKNNIKGNTPKLKAILNDFGVRKVTDLKEEDFPAVLKALEEI